MRPSIEQQRRELEKTDIPCTARRARSTLAAHGREMDLTQDGFSSALNTQRSYSGHLSTCSEPASRSRHMPGRQRNAGKRPGAVGTASAEVTELPVVPFESRQ